MRCLGAFLGASDALLIQCGDICWGCRESKWGKSFVDTRMLSEGHLQEETLHLEGHLCVT